MRNMQNFHIDSGSCFQKRTDLAKKEALLLFHPCLLFPAWNVNLMVGAPKAICILRKEATLGVVKERSKGTCVLDNWVDVMPNLNCLTWDFFCIIENFFLHYLFTDTVNSMILTI
jgi:hypothetical protein